MNKKDFKTQIQPMEPSSFVKDKVASYDVETIHRPTEPLIHQTARFFFIRSGEGVLKIQNKSHPIARGSLVCILPWQVTEVVEIAETLQFEKVIYCQDLFHEIIKSLLNIYNEDVKWIQALSMHSVVSCDDDSYQKVLELFDKLHQELGMNSAHDLSSKPLSAIYVSSLLIELIVLYYRLTPEPASKKNAPIDNIEIFQYIYHNLNKKLTLSSLSRLFFMSEQSLSRYINRMTGLSFYDLIHEMRIARIMNFLIYTDLTLEELAQILGYVDAPHLSKAFISRVGMKTHEYRNTYRLVNEICKTKEHKNSYAVISYIYRNYQLPLSANGVAKQFGMSRETLVECMKYQVEQSFDQFLNAVRIQQAAALLVDTDRTIREISQTVGYPQIKTFNRNFLKIYRMTPTEFRKNIMDIT